MKFTGLCLITKNVPALAAFYGKVLGVEAEGDEVHVEMHTTGAGLTIYGFTGMESLAPGSMEGAGYGSFTLSFEVQDVDVEYERLKTLEVEFIKLPTTHPWGTRSCWFRDPDGNIVNFFTNLSKQ
jgi:catechol 2,3-dioxygenase-like lactoylglutathione lyase family enzyme